MCMSKELVKLQYINSVEYLHSHLKNENHMCQEVIWKDLKNALFSRNKITMSKCRTFV